MRNRDILALKVRLFGNRVSGAAVPIGYYSPVELAS